jgi:hypothetical protein
MPPLVTNLNPSAAIAVVFLSVGLVATLFHFAPRSVFSGFGQPVGNASFSGCLSLQASTTTGITSSQVQRGGRSSLSAVATTIPSDATPIFRSHRQHGPASESLSSQVQPSHGSLSIADQTVSVQ